VVYFFALSTKERFFNRTIIFLQRLSNPVTQNEMEEKMKKTSTKSGFLCVEVSVNIGLTTNVNLGKQGGGGANI
jgi:hypothetical protein